MCVLAGDIGSVGKKSAQCWQGIRGKNALETAREEDVLLRPTAREDERVMETGRVKSRFS